MNIQVGKTYQIQHWYSSTFYTVKVIEITEDHVRMVCMGSAREIRMMNDGAKHYTWDEVA